MLGYDFCRKRALLHFRGPSFPAMLHIAPCVCVPVSGTGLAAGVHSVTPALLFYLHFCTNYDPHKNINSESEVDTASDAGLGKHYITDGKYKISKLI